MSLNTDLELCLEFLEPSGAPVDVSPNAYTQTVAAGATRESGGKYGGSKFAMSGGATGYISSNFSQTLSDCTIIAWVSDITSPAAFDGIVHSQGGGSDQCGVQIGPSGDLGYMWGGVFYDFESGLAVPEDSNIHMIAMRVTPAGAKLFLDGVFSDPVVAAHATCLINNLNIGRSAFGGRDLQCKFHAVYVWSRGLTDQEIEFVYNNSNGRQYTSSAPVPVLNGGAAASVNYLEGTNGPIISDLATDYDTLAGYTATKVTISGDDSALFLVQFAPPNSLEWGTEPDYEDPQDANTNNAYELTLTYETWGGTTNQDLTVNVVVAASADEDDLPISRELAYDVASPTNAGIKYLRDYQGY